MEKLGFFFIDVLDSVDKHQVIIHFIQNADDRMTGPDDLSFEIAHLQFERIPFFRVQLFLNIRRIGLFQKQREKFSRKTFCQLAAPFRKLKSHCLAVGEGKLDKDGNRVPVPVTVGDKVIYSKYSGTEVELSKDDKVIIVRQSDILAVIEK